MSWKKYCTKISTKIREEKMNILDKLTEYINENNIDYNFIAKELEVEAKELKKKLLWDKNMLISEMEDIFTLLNISYEDLVLNSEGNIIKQISFDSSIEDIMESLSEDEQEFVQELMRLVESNTQLKNEKSRKMYIN